MKKLTLKPAAAKAIAIGSLCSVAYLAVYVAKNVLSAASPQITQQGAFTVETIGTLSSVYYITYALGQLINGVIGDRIKSKYMISFGLILASLGFVLLPQLTGLPNIAILTYGSAGFFLAMIYGPMTKVVAENTEPIYATRCSLGYTFSSFFGSPAAGLLAASLAWQWAFRAAGGIMVVMGVICFGTFTLMERKGIVKYGQFKPAEKNAAGGIKLLLKRQIVKYTFVSILTGVIRTAVVFWLPTYISQHLGFAPDTAALLFTVASLGISFNAPIAIFLYERLRRNMDLTILLFFVASALGFLAAYFVTRPMANIVCMVLAIIAADCASTMMWSRYCPSLYDTGLVSSATGFLDCCSYLAASASSALFANAVGTVGWGWLILIWCGLMVCGVGVCLPWKRGWKSLFAGQ